MEKIDKNLKYRLSENVVSREIDGEIIIVPLTGGIGDSEDDLFSLNETGKVLWKYLDGTMSVNDILLKLKNSFEGDDKEVEKDVIGFLEELISRKIVEKV